CSKPAGSRLSWSLLPLLQQLARKAKRTKYVRPINLPSFKVKPGDVCSVAGWGKMAPRGKLSNTLQEVELTVQKDQECESYFKGHYNKASQICAGDPKIKRASYKGDSGGPLVCKKAAAGIVSFGRPDGSAPRVFTRAIAVQKARESCKTPPKDADQTQEHQVLWTVSTLPSSDPSSLPGTMSPVLILLTFLLPLGAGAEKIIGGHEVSPHSRPYMAYVKFLDVDGKKKFCGGFLVRDKFVLTAAHCMGSSMKVILGAHNIKAQEETQQIIPVAKATLHPAYNPKDHSNDIMLLKLQSPAKMTKAVRPLNLPRRKVHVKPGDVCSVAGWGKMAPEGEYPNTLQEVELTVQEDQQCEPHYRRYYNKANQICVGDPEIKRASFQEIIGGHEVKPHSRPYMAFIESVDVDGSKHYSGGFLVEDNFVLTAAHCRGSSMTVTLGAHNITAQEETQQIIPVEKRIPHPAYNAKDHSNDIMILKLQSPAKMTKAVRPLNLPRRKVHVKPGDVCSVAGWGKMGPEGKFPNTLQEVPLTVQKDQLCESRFQGHYNKSNEICVGDPKIKNASYVGDSGGPLVCKKAAAGVVSYGDKDGSAPEVFIRVSSFLSWIRKTMKRC
ncbi:hypothetical protein A6R68_05621, partial [Neotoma lepida]